MGPTFLLTKNASRLFIHIYQSYYVQLFICILLRENKYLALRSLQSATRGWYIDFPHFLKPMRKGNENSEEGRPF